MFLWCKKKKKKESNRKKERKEKTKAMRAISCRSVIKMRNITSQKNWKLSKEKYLSPCHLTFATNVCSESLIA